MRGSLQATSVKGLMACSRAGSLPQGFVFVSSACALTQYLPVVSPSTHVHEPHDLHLTLRGEVMAQGFAA